MKLALIALLLGLTPLPAAAAPVLERVVILQRHGVRAPTKAPAELAPFASQPWAAWPVAPGELTDHGAAALKQMGEALHRRYAALLKPGDCGRVLVWADNADQRTRRSGTVMAAALGCPGTAQWAKGDRDPLFHGSEICPADPSEAKAEIADRLDGVLAARRQNYDGARASLAKILTPERTQASCSENQDKACTLLADRNSIKAGGRLSGSLADGSTLSENLFLEYAQGMEHPGWGRLGEKELDAIMPLHEIASDLGRRTPLLAAHNASLLARQIQAFLTGASFRVTAPAEARVILLAGHDTNLSNIAGMLGLNWTLPGEPDATAPDTALAFELWKGEGGPFVRLRLFFQTARQLREASVLKAAPMLPLAAGGCTQSCPLTRFSNLLGAAVAKECLERGQTK